MWCVFPKLSFENQLLIPELPVGAIMIAPLVKAFPTRTVLAGAVLFFALMTTSTPKLYH